MTTRGRTPPAALQIAAVLCGGPAAFVDALKGDYRLAAPLPLDRKGPAADDPELKVDRAGEPRPADRAPDAGEYQYRRK